MNDTKPWYQSTAVWASLVTVLVSLATAFGVIDAAAGSTISEQLPGLIVSVVTAILGALSLFGRVTAKTEITASAEPTKKV